jgi:hypothetical protein
MRISSGTATLIGAGMAFVGVVVGTGLAQWGAAKLEDRRARTEIVVEMMRSNDREQMLKKLQILNDSGLLPDEDGRLRQAVGGAPVAAFESVEVKVPIAVRCIDPKDIPPELARPEISKDARRAALQVTAHAIRLRSQNEMLRAMLIACTDGLPGDAETAGGAKQ